MKSKTHIRWAAQVANHIQRSVVRRKAIIRSENLPVNEGSNRQTVEDRNAALPDFLIILPITLFKKAQHTTHWKRLIRATEKENILGIVAFQRKEQQ